MTEWRTWIRTCVALLISVGLHWLILFFGYYADKNPSGSNASRESGFASKEAITVRLVGAPDSLLKKEPVESPVHAVTTNQRESKPDSRDPVEPGLPAPYVTDGLLPLDAPHYFTASELDKRPALLMPVDLEQSAASQLEEGYLLLRLLISETGDVEKVVVILNDSAGPIEEAAVQAFGRAQFTAGFLRGVAVKSQVLIEVKLHPKF